MPPGKVVRAVLQTMCRNGDRVQAPTEVLTLPGAQYAIRRFAQTLALLLRQVALPRVLAELPEPASLTHAVTTGACSVACEAITGVGRG